MNIEEIKGRLYKIYDREWIDKWLKRPIPFMPYNGKTPLEVFGLPEAQKFVENLLLDLEKKV